MSEHADTRHPVRVVVATAAALVSGAGVALQSRINGQLGAELGDGVVAAFLSFASGLAILAVMMLASPHARRGAGRVLGAVRARRIPWWYLLGGAAGAFFVLGQTSVVGLLGVALFTVGVVAGQLTSSSLLDRRGLGTMPPRALTRSRVAGALLAIAGVVVAVWGQVAPGAPWWLIVVPFAAGLGVGYQQAANGQVRGVAESWLAATFGNFVVGTVLLGIALLVHLVLVPWPDAFPASPLLYLGGVVGVVFIATQVVVVRTTGVLVMGLAILSGQLAAAVLFDLLLPLPGSEFAVTAAAGAAITLVAVMVAVIPWRRMPRRGRGLQSAE